MLTHRTEYESLCIIAPCRRVVGADGSLITNGANIYRHRKESHLTIHLSFAMANMTCGRADRALECLDGYERAVRAWPFPIELHGDDFFDKTQSWLDDTNGIGTSAPRDDALVKKSLVDSVAANPAFEPLSDDPRFKRIVESLREVAR